MSVSAISAPTIVSIVPDLGGTFLYGVHVLNVLSVTLDGPLPPGARLEFAADNAPAPGSLIDGFTSTPVAAAALGGVSLLTFELPLSMGLFAVGAGGSATAFVWIRVASGLVVQRRAVPFAFAQSDAAVRLVNALLGAAAPADAAAARAVAARTGVSPPAEPLVPAALVVRTLADPAARPSPWTLSSALAPVLLGATVANAFAGDVFFGGDYGVAYNVTLGWSYSSASGALSLSVAGGVTLLLRGVAASFPFAPASSADLAGAPVVATAALLGGAVPPLAAAFAAPIATGARGLPAALPFTLTLASTASPAAALSVAVQVAYALSAPVGAQPLVDGFFYLTSVAAPPAAPAALTAPLAAALVGPAFSSLPARGFTLAGAGVVPDAAPGTPAYASGLTLAFAPGALSLALSYALPPHLEAALGGVVGPPDALPAPPYPGTAVAVVAAVSVAGGALAPAAVAGWPVAFIAGAPAPALSAAAAASGLTEPPLVAVALPADARWTTPADGLGGGGGPAVFAKWFDAPTSRVLANARAPLAAILPSSGAAPAAGALAAGVSVYTGRAVERNNGATPRLRVRRVAAGAVTDVVLDVSIVPASALPGLADGVASAFAGKLSAAGAATATPADYQADFDATWAELAVAPSRAAAAVPRGDWASDFTRAATAGVVAVARALLAGTDDGRWNDARAGADVRAGAAAFDIVVALLPAGVLPGAGDVFGVVVSNAPVVLGGGGGAGAGGAGGACPALPLVTAAAAAPVAARAVFAPNGFDGFPAVAAAPRGTGVALVPVNVVTAAEYAATGDAHFIFKAATTAAEPDVVGLIKLTAPATGCLLAGVAGACSIADVATEGDGRAALRADVAQDWTAAPAAGSLYPASLAGAATFELAVDAAFSGTAAGGPAPLLASLTLRWTVPPAAYTVRYYTSAADATGMLLPNGEVFFDPLALRGRAPAPRVDVIAPGAEAAGLGWEGIRFTRLVVDVTYGWPGSGSTPARVTLALDAVEVRVAAELPDFTAAVAWVRNAGGPVTGAGGAGARVFFSAWLGAGAATLAARTWAPPAAVPPLAGVQPADALAFAAAADGSCALLVVADAAPAGGAAGAATTRLVAALWVPGAGAGGGAWAAAPAALSPAALGGAASFRGAVVRAARPAELLAARDAYAAPPSTRPPVFFHVAFLADALDAARARVAGCGARYVLVAATVNSAGAWALTVFGTGGVAGADAAAPLPDSPAPLDALVLAPVDYGYVLAAAAGTRLLLSELALPMAGGAPGAPLPPAAAGFAWTRPVGVALSAVATAAGGVPEDLPRVAALRVAQPAAPLAAADAVPNATARALRALAVEAVVVTRGVPPSGAAVAQTLGSVRATLLTPALAIAALSLHGVDSGPTATLTALVVVANAGAARSAPARLNIYASDVATAAPAAAALLRTVPVAAVPAGGSVTVAVPFAVADALARANANWLVAELLYVDMSGGWKAATADGAGVSALELSASRDVGAGAATGALAVVARARVALCSLYFSAPPTAHALTGVTFTITNWGACGAPVDVRLGQAADACSCATCAAAERLLKVAPWSNLSVTVPWTDAALSGAAFATPALALRIRTPDASAGTVWTAPSPLVPAAGVPICRAPNAPPPAAAGAAFLLPLGAGGAGADAAAPPPGAFAAARPGLVHVALTPRLAFFPAGGVAVQPDVPVAAAGGGAATFAHVVAAVVASAGAAPLSLAALGALTFAGALAGAAPVRGCGLPLPPAGAPRAVTTGCGSDAHYVVTDARGRFVDFGGAALADRLLLPGQRAAFYFSKDDAAAAAAPAVLTLHQAAAALPASALFDTRLPPAPAAAPCGPRGPLGGGPGGVVDPPPVPPALAPACAATLVPSTALAVFANLPAPAIVVRTQAAGALSSACDAARGASACTAIPGCGWCATAPGVGACLLAGGVAGGSDEAVTPPAACAVAAGARWIAVDACLALPRAACGWQSGCGWCAAGSALSTAACLTGTAAGPAVAGACPPTVTGVGAAAVSVPNWLWNKCSDLVAVPAAGALTAGCSAAVGCGVCGAACQPLATPCAAGFSAPAGAPAAYADLCSGFSRFNCSGNLGCGWCDATATVGACVPGGATGPLATPLSATLTSPAACDGAWTFVLAAPPAGVTPSPNAAGVPCAAIKTQAGCLASRGCGFCATTGACAAGGPYGPAEGACAAWAVTWAGGVPASESPTASPSPTPSATPTLTRTGTPTKV